MRAAGVNVVEILTPEHGITGKLDQANIPDSTDAATGLRVVSMYRNSRFRMTPEMLSAVDLLAFDVQDVGARFFTHGCTMLDALELAAKSKVPFYVLDRPNPVSGVHIEGPMMDPALETFVGCFDIPIRYGLTL